MNEQRKQLIASFLKRVDELPTGDRTVLKRSAGKMLSEADGRAVTAFYRCFPGNADERMADRWFASACFHCMWDTGSSGTAFEQILCKLKDESSSAEHRFAALLDQRWENDGFFLTKLSRMIKMMYQKGYCVNCAALLEDLLYWNADSHFIQRKWAQAMYRIKDITEEKGDITNAV